MAALDSDLSLLRLPALKYEKSVVIISQGIKTVLFIIIVFLHI